MGCEIIRIDNNTWRIEDGGVRFFLLTGTERALLVDSGMMTHDARDIAESLTDLPVLLINTHADGDHTGSNAQFEEFYMSPKEEPVYRRRNSEGKILPVREGDVIDLGNRELRIIDLPGHTPGSIAILDVVNRVLISGDPIQDGRIFMFGDHRNMRDYCSSLYHLDQYRSAFDEIWPSHSTFPVKPALIELLKEGAASIIKGKAAYTTENFHGTDIRVYNMGYATFLCDESIESRVPELTTLCYLEKDDSYLMLHRVKKVQDINKDKYIGVGGHFRYGESPDECLRREVKEETGLTLGSYRSRGLVTFRYGEDVTEYMHLYTADAAFADDTLPECNEGELVWVVKDRVGELPIWEGDRIFFRLLREERPYFSLKLVYAQDGELLRAELDGEALPKDQWF